MFVGPVTANELLGTKLEKSGDIDLGEAPVYISKTGGTEYGVVVDFPLSKDRFHKFLDATAPYQGSGTYAVLADWRMPDMDDKYSKGLLHGHMAHLGENFREFERHRRLFLNVLQSNVDVPNAVDIPELEPHHYAQFRFLGYSVGRKATARQVFSSHGDIRRRFAEYVVSQSPPKNKKYMQNWDTSRIIAAFSGLYSEKRSALLGQFFRNLSPAEKAEVLQHYVQFNGSIWLRDEFGEIRVYTSGVLRPDKITVLRNDLIFEARLEEIRGEVKYKVLPETVRKKEPSVVPAISWKSGNWSIDPDYNFYQTAQDKFGQERDFIGNAPVINSLAGLLFVAYCSPDIRSSSNIWPDKLGFGKSGFQQTMGAAQVPVLALMRRKELMESRFVRAVEEYAESFTQSHLADEGVSP